MTGTLVGPNDAQTIAFLLQKQLEDIDNEIRLIKEEKQSTELRTEELESRVNVLDLSVSLTNHCDLNPSPSSSQMGLIMMKQQQKYNRHSPVNSGRSTPSQKSDMLKIPLNKSTRLEDEFKSMTVSSSLFFNFSKLILKKNYFLFEKY